jgi:hypothetical protein
MNAAMLVLFAAMTCQQTPKTAKPDEAALARINQVRKSAGLAPVTLDPVLCKACAAHALYVARNLELPNQKLMLNDEDPSRPGYSAEGRRVAPLAYTIIGQGPVGATEWVLSTCFPRSHLLHPNLKRIGIGSAIDRKKTQYSVVDLRNGQGQNRPVFYPVDGQKDVPLAFVGPENPDPIPKEEGKQPGFPITVSFPRTG